MGDVDLQGQPAGLEDNLEFVADCCRYAENILSEEAIKKKYRFDDATWESLGENDDARRSHSSRPKKYAGYATAAPNESARKN
jgi:hypothetical protein